MTSRTVALRTGTSSRGIWPRLAVKLFVAVMGGRARPIDLSALAVLLRGQYTNLEKLDALLGRHYPVPILFVVAVSPEVFAAGWHFGDFGDFGAACVAGDDEERGPHN